MQKTNAVTSRPRRAGSIVFALALLLASANTTLSAPQAGLSRYDRMRTGRTTFAAPTNPKFDWNYATGSSCSATPVIAEDGTVYFGATDKYLYAITKTGSLAWRYRANSSITGSAAIGLDPNMLNAYSNRAAAYMYTRQYDKSWDDVHFIESRGAGMKPEFMAELRRLSGRDR